MYISIDIGRTNTRVASSKDLVNLHQSVRFLTEPILKNQQQKLKEAIEKVSEGEKPKFGCVGIPGIIDREKNEFIRVNLYPELNGFTYMMLLQGCLETFPVYVENDALLSGYAEAVAGSGKEFNIVCYLTLSSGVGGVRVSYKTLDRTVFYSEPGHMIIMEGGRPDKTCGQRGCLESYTSGTSFKEIYGMEPKDCNDEAIWNDYSKHLASGLVNIMAMWAPEVVVLGGGVSQKFDFIYTGLMDNLKKQRFFPVPEIRKSAFGDDSGIKGGFIYLTDMEKIAAIAEKGL
jgi:glucokinase